MPSRKIASKRKWNVVPLLKASAKLKEIQRRGWKVAGGIASPESVADHSFRMAILGAYLADSLGLDPGKVMRMCLIHDISESEIGDLMPEEKISENQHRKEEDRVARSLFETVPPKSGRVFLSDWKELEERKTAEAKLVWEIDKLEMGLTMRDYVRSGGDPKKLERFSPTEYLSKGLRALFEEY
jgi:putative hydrolase of HD superfamily